MIQKIVKYGFILFILILFGCGEKRVDWTPTFDSEDKIPLGTYILRQELDAIFPDSHIENIEVNTHSFFDEIEYEYRADHYLLINDNFHHDSATWEKILKYVERGGSAFISISDNIPSFDSILGTSVDSITRNPNKSAVALTVKTAKDEKSYIYEKKIQSAYFSKFNTETTDVLGYLNYDKKNYPNFIKVYHGNGYLLLHTEPVAFTNYHMLKKNHFQYVTNVFSYLNSEDIIWDNHRMNYRSSSSEQSHDGGFFSSLAFVMKHQSLRWAFFLLLIMGALYLLINSKRRQKPIPIILPYKNYTLGFAQTLSELYQNNPDHTALSKYKINYFLGQIKQHYNITAKEMEKDFAQLLSDKSGVEFTLCDKLVTYITIFQNKNYLDKEDFFKLQSLIESFNQKSNNYGRTYTQR